MNFISTIALFIFLFGIINCSHDDDEYNSIEGIEYEDLVDQSREEIENNEEESDEASYAKNLMVCRAKTRENLTKLYQKGKENFIFLKNLGQLKEKDGGKNWYTNMMTRPFYVPGRKSGLIGRLRLYRRRRQFIRRTVRRPYYVREQRRKLFSTKQFGK